MSIILALVTATPGVTALTIEPDFQGGSAVTTADFDLDGRLDLAAAGYYEDSFTIWLQLEAGEWDRRDVLSINGAYSIKTADIDQDGDPDLYGSSRTNSEYGEDSVWWFENRLLEESHDFLPHFIFNFPNQDPHSMDAADFDGDGTIDIGVAWVYDSNLHLFFNEDGTGDSLGQSVTLIDVPGVNGCSLIRGDDFDGDGDVDVIGAAPWGGTNNYYWFRKEDDGSYSELIPIAVGIEYSGAFAVAIADLDGDGWKDIVTSSDDNNPSSNSHLRWVKRLNAEGTAWAAGVDIDDQYFGGDGDQSLMAVDLDDDGDLDLLGASPTYFPGAHIWLNQGRGQFRSFNLDPHFNAHGVTADDIDGDGKLEVIAASWGVCCYSGEIRAWDITP